MHKHMTHIFGFECEGFQPLLEDWNRMMLVVSSGCDFRIPSYRSVYRQLQIPATVQMRYRFIMVVAWQQSSRPR